MVVNVFNPSTLKAVADLVLCVRGQSGILKPCLKKGNMRV